MQIGCTGVNILNVHLDLLKQCKDNRDIIVMNSYRQRCIKLEQQWAVEMPSTTLEGEVELDEKYYNLRY